MINIHASCVAVDGFAALLLGPSGSGKSDLCLRLLDRGGALVADDRVELFARNGALLARPPKALSGLIEARGIGVLRWSDRAIPPTPVAAAVSLAPGSNPERAPDPEWETYCGIGIPLWRLDPFTAAAPEKVGLVLRAARGDISVVT